MNIHEYQAKKLLGISVDELNFWKKIIPDKELSSITKKIILKFFLIKLFPIVIGNLPPPDIIPIQFIIKDLQFPCYLNF